MKQRRYAILFFILGVFFAFIFSLTIDYSKETKIHEFDVGDYFVHAKKINGTLVISPELRNAFKYANVSEKKHLSCVKLIEDCNLKEGNCTIKEMSSCLIKESVINFNTVKNGNKPYACPNCPEKIKVRNEFERGDYDNDIVEKIKKVQSDEDWIKLCYSFLKYQCIKNECTKDMLTVKCLSSEDAEEYIEYNYK